MSPSNPSPSARTAYLGLGSNLGDRRANLASAVAALGRIAGVRVARLSPLYATAPWGVAAQPEFLNAAAAVETALDPETLLEACLAIERDLGRVRAERWGPRTIDIDLLVYGDRVARGERLTLPHPRIRERAFVLAPLADIAPDLLLDGRTIAQWAAAADASGVRRLGSLSA